ncbi:hypothetical protein C8A00DRAFT_19027 [Chaetomidium leptoderma]|uniref:Velvet domain-containing protein n=1 Tax=Chaetomidium leptoderma TaxID=669021 RepID=A0AAN6VD92_9PEZI|nr:hypothetical protein C8A00DRAFT_19027 [Chaetomidium leptoderma]
MATQTNPTMTMVMQPPPLVQKDSIITPAVEVKVQFDQNHPKRHLIGEVFATAAVLDSNGDPVANLSYNYEGVWGARKPQTVENSAQFTFPRLWIAGSGTYQLRISAHLIDTDEAQSKVLCQVDSVRFFVV